MRRFVARDAIVNQSRWAVDRNRGMVERVGEGCCFCFCFHTSKIVKVGLLHRHATRVYVQEDVKGF